MKFLLEHKLPKKVRYARVYFEAGPTSVLFSLDGTSADWHASIGTRKGVKMSDAEYTKLRAQVPAIELLDEDEKGVLIRNAAGYEELWEKPRWTLTRAHRSREKDE